MTLLPPRYQDTILVQYELVTAPGWIMSVLFSLTLLAVMALFSDPIIVKQKPFIRLGTTEKKNENDGRTFFSMIFSSFPFSSFFSSNVGKLSTRSSSSLDASGVSTSGGTYGAIPVEEQVICIELGDLMDKGEGNIPAIDEEYGCKLVDVSEKRKKPSASMANSISSSTSTSVISPLRSAFSQSLNSNLPLSPEIAKQINKDSGNIHKIGNKSIRENEKSKNNKNDNNSNNNKDEETRNEREDDINLFPVEQLKPIINLSNSNINLNSIAGHEIKRNLSQTANLYATSSPSVHNHKTRKDINIKESNSLNTNDNINNGHCVIKINENNCVDEAEDNNVNNNINDNNDDSKNNTKSISDKNSTTYYSNSNSNSNNSFALSDSASSTGKMSGSRVGSFLVSNSANSSGKMSSGKLSMGSSIASSRRGSTETIESGRDTLSSLDVRTLSKNKNRSDVAFTTYDNIGTNGFGMKAGRGRGEERLNEEDRSLYDATTAMSSSGRFVLEGSSGTYTYNYKKRDIEGDDNDSCWLCCNLFGIEVAVILFIYLINKTGQEMIVSSIPSLSSQIFGWDSQRAGFFMATMGVNI